MNAKITRLILLTLLLALPILACAADSGSGGGTSSRVGSGELLKLLPEGVSRIQVMAADEITGGSVPESMTGLFEETRKDYSPGGGDEIVTVADVDQIVRALSPDGGIVMLSGIRIDFAAIGQWPAKTPTSENVVSGRRNAVARSPSLSPGLVVFQRPEIVPAPLQHLSAQLPLAVQYAPGNHPFHQFQLAQQVLGHPRFTLLVIPPYPRLSQYQAALTGVCRHQPGSGQLPATYPPQRLVGALPPSVKTSDGGVDGRLYYRGRGTMAVQVKGGARLGGRPR